MYLAEVAYVLEICRSLPHAFAVITSRVIRQQKVKQLESQAKVSKVPFITATSISQLCYPSKHCLECEYIGRPSGCFFKGSARLVTQIQPSNQLASHTRPSK